MDRAFDSGVFARDLDVLIDLVELEITEDLLKQQINKVSDQIYKKALHHYNLKYYQNKVGLDDLESSFEMEKHVNKALTTDEYVEVNNTLKLLKVS